MPTPLRRLTLAALLAACASLPAEDYQDRLKETDLRDPDAVYELAMWCGENRREREKLTHLREIIKMAPDHGAAREALGFVLYKGVWTHKSRVPAGAVGGSGAPGQPGMGNPAGLPAGPAGPGPSAGQIEWSLAPLTHPDIDSPRGDHVRSWIEKIQGVGNQTNVMESGWRTLLMEEHFDLAIPILSQGMAEGRYTDCFAPAMMIDDLRRSKDPRLAQAEKLLPFIIAVASKGGASKEDQQVAAMVAGSSGQKKALPWLIGLMGDSDEFTRSAASQAVSAITFLPEQGLNKEKAQEWWDRYHNQPDSAIYGQLLESKDPMTRYGACERLYREQDRRILPVLAGLLRSDNRTAAIRSVALIQRISGNDWGLYEAEGELRENMIAQYENWVKTESNRFTWIEFRQAELPAGAAPRANPTDEAGQAIAQLSSVQSTDVLAAENRLRALEAKVAVPALIQGLLGGDPITMNKCNTLLREITKQNFGFDPLADEPTRKAAAARWKQWADQEYALDQGDPGEETLERAPATPAPPQPRQDRGGAL